MTYRAEYNLWYLRKLLAIKEISKGHSRITMFELSKKRDFSALH